MQISAATVESRMELPEKIKSETAYDPAIPLLGILSKKPETLIQKNICTPTLIVMLFSVTKIWKQPKCPSVDEWIKHLLYIYTGECYSAPKKKNISHFTTAWMNLKSIMLSEISQSEKEECHIISLVCGI